MGLCTCGVSDGEGEIGVADHLTGLVEDSEGELDETTWGVVGLARVESEDPPVKGLDVINSVVPSDSESIASGDEGIGTGDESRFAGAKVVNSGVDKL